MGGNMVGVYTGHAQARVAAISGVSARPLADYWQARITATLHRLEREARRMFQLEQDLAEFAQRYYEAVGGAAQRLAQMEAALEQPINEEAAQAIPAVMAQRDAVPNRGHELKLRYRSLAKEIHPDRAMVVESTGIAASTMHALNAAYQQGDLAVMLRLEAQMLLARLAPDGVVTVELESALRDVERAADTYADSYRAMLGSPLNELMLRAMSARLAGWDWIEVVVRKLERTIEEKERALVEASIEQIGAWRQSVSVA
jgi:hypothetical protein